MKYICGYGVSSHLGFMRKSIAVLFFASGVSGLIYQLLWIREFTYLLGSAYLTVSIVVAAFMAGLLAGAWLAGKYIARIKNRIKWYAFLEIFVGIYAIAFAVGFPAFDFLFGAIAVIFGNADVLRIIATALVVILIMLPPTCAMGATLPLLVHHFTRTSSEFKNNISLFYSINTLGAALGVLIAGFYLVEKTGISTGILITGIFNMLIGSIAWVLYRRAEEKLLPETVTSPEQGKLRNQKKKTDALSPKSPAPSINNSKWLILGVAGLAGFTSLSYEITWTRSLKFLIQSSTYSFTVILFIFLLGIAAGAEAAEKIMRNKSNLLFKYGCLQMVLACSALFTLIFLYQLAYTKIFQEDLFNVIFNYSYGWFSGILVYALTCGITFFLPALIMGILFPILNELYFDQSHEPPGKSVSNIYVINSAGSIAGALATGFILIPAMGIKGSILLLACINFLIAAVFILKSKHKNPFAWVGGGMAFGLLVIFSLQGKFLSSKEELKNDKVVFYKEGLSATVKVYQQKNDLNMSIDGMEIASTSNAFLQKERLIAHLPFFIRPQIQNVLSVGLASGISTASIAEHESVKKIDCVELVKPVFEASTFFSAYNNNVQKNPKVNLVHNDIYAFLKFNPSTYDLISSDGKLGTLDNANTTMLSDDYYHQCKMRLNPGGLFIQWIPLITPNSSFELILQTLKHSFQHVSIFYFYPSDVFMVASEEPFSLNLQQMNRVMQDSSVRAELTSLGFGKASNIMCSYIGDYENTNKAIQLNTMDRPLLEFWFYRDWKKGNAYEGGYRAANLGFLVNNFQKQEAEALRIYQGFPNESYAKGIFNSSLNFYQFCVMNFKNGNYEKGLEEYNLFRSSIPF